MKGSGPAARLDGLSGLPHRDRLCARRSQRMPAAEAAAEHDNQSWNETHAEYPNASRSHGPIVAAGRNFDK